MDYKDFEKNNLHVLRQSQTIATMNVLFYLVISLVKIAIGTLAKSTALKADGYNGATDTLAYLIIIMGITFAKRPRDREHHFGYAKAETVSTLITAVLIIETGFGVIGKSFLNWLQNSSEKPDFIAALVGISTGILTWGCFLLNQYFARRINSQPLLASAKDQEADAITSILTGLAIVISNLGLPWIDKFTGVIIGCLMLRTGFLILNISAFRLIDGFSTESLHQIRQQLKRFSQIKHVIRISGREYENDIYITAVVQVEASLTVSDTAKLTRTIQNYLQRRCGIFELDMQYVI